MINTWVTLTNPMSRCPMWPCKLLQNTCKMARSLLHTRLSDPTYHLYKKGLTPEAYGAHQQISGQPTSLSQEIALLRLLLEEILLESGGCDTKSIIECAKAIGRLVQVQAELTRGGVGDAAFVQNLAEDLRKFHENAAPMMPGGAMFGAGYLTEDG
jgi:hypothetical protein